jgi:hypothetical protein
MFARLAPRWTPQAGLRRARRACRPLLDRMEDRTLLSFGFGSGLGFGGPGASSAGMPGSVAVDAAGNILVTGNLNGGGSVDFDQDPGTPSTVNTTGAAFLARYTPNPSVPGGLSLSWAQTISSPNGIVAVANTALDAAGNVYVTGRLLNTTFEVSPGAPADFSFGANTVTTNSYSEAFVAKYDASGTNQWAFRMGPGIGSGLAYFRDSSGHDDLYVTGQAWPGAATFGPSNTSLGVTIPSGHAAPFVWKLDTTGADATTLPASLWFRVANTASGAGAASAVAVDPAGNAYLTGSFSGTVDFDPGPGTFSLTSYTARGGTVANDAMIWKLTAAGNFAWAGQLGGQKTDSGAAIALDGAGNLYVTGRFNFGAGTGSDSNDFDPGKGKVSLPGGGMFVGKYTTSAGAYVWAKGIDTGGGTALALDAAGNVYTTGWFWGTADFDPGNGVRNLSSGPVPSVYVCKLSPTGQYLDAANFVVSDPASTGNTGSTPGGIAVDGSGNALIVGGFSGQIDLDPTSGTYNQTSALDVSTNPPQYRNAGFIARLTQPAGAAAASSLTAGNLVALAPIDGPPDRIRPALRGRFLLTARSRLNG